MRASPRLALVAGVWGAWMLLHLVRTGDPATAAPLQRWTEFAVRWQLADLRRPSAAGQVRAAIGHLSAMGLMAVFALACAGTGRPVVRWLGAGRAGPPFALRILFGFGVSGAWLLGLAVTGLWHPVVMLLLPGVMAATEIRRGMKHAEGRGSGDTVLKGTGVPGMSRSVRSVPGPAWLAFGSVIPGLLSAFLPDVSGDPDKVHLAAVSQWLIARRLDGFAPSVGIHFPMTVELHDAFALLAGRTELAHLFHLVPFLAAVAMIAGRAAAVGGPAAGWLAGLGVMTLGTVGEQIGTAKSDLGAAAFLVAGAMAAVAPAGGARFAAAGALFGIGAACKINGMAVAATVAVLAAFLPGRGSGRRFLPWIAGTALPVLPWVAKNWLFFGDPVWPALSGRLPGTLWDATDARALALLMGDAEMTRGRWAGLPSQFARGLALAQPAAALAIPVVVAGIGAAAPGTRWLAGLGVAAFAAVAAAAPFEVLRLALPAWMLMIAAGSVPVAAAAGRWKSGRARLAGWGAAILAWVPLAGNLMSYPEPGLAVAWLTGVVDRTSYHRAAWTSYDEVRAAVAALPDARRIILMGDGRFSRYRCRVVTERFPGRNFGWEAAGDAATAARVAVRMRQLGCGWIVYNVVWEPFPHPVETAWTWDDRRLAVWREFAARYLEVVRPPVGADEPNGGFALLRLRSRPLARAPERMAYLPGLQSLTFPFMQAGLTGRAAEGADLALAVTRRVPGIHALADLAGTFCDLQERWTDVARVLRPGVLDGYAGLHSRERWVRAMDRLGRGAEARRLLARKTTPAPRPPGSRPGR